MRLYLMRHGIAAPPDPLHGMRDPLRPLTAAGRERTAGVAAGLERLGVKPQALASSPYRRAIETADIVADQLGIAAKVRFETTTLEPDSHPTQFLGWLRKHQAQSWLCVGHLPHLDLALGELLTGTRAVVGSFKKAAVAALELDAAMSGQASLLWFMPPRALRLIATSSDEAGGADD